MMEGDATYFRRRARDERLAAMKALHPVARAAHLEMAERYDDLAAAIATHDPPILSLVPHSPAA
jgi:hypothetical protein